MPTPVASDLVPSDALHPRFVCRTGGLSASRLVALRAPETIDALAQARALDDSARREIEPLVDALHRAVGGEDDRAHRRALLRLKRDVHNGRIPRPRDLDAAAPRLEATTLEALRRLRAMLENRDATLQRAARSFEREQAAARRALQDAVADESFGKGLLLSSRTLARGVERYRQADPARPNAKERQVERGLLRYLTRAARKATPFSTLCTLLPGTVSPKAVAPGPGRARPSFDRPPNAPRSHLRLDKGLLARLKPHLARHPAIRRRLPVEANPTLQVDTPWLFLAAHDGREVFQRLPPNPALTLLLDLLGGAGRPTWDEVVEALADHPEVDADAATAAAYVDRLLEIGLLRWRFGIPEQEVRWDEPLADWLESLDEPTAEAVAASLRALRRLAERYAAAPLEARAEILDQATAAVRALFAPFEGDGREGGPRSAIPPPFYEDAGGDASLDLDARALEPVASRLVEYVRATLPLAYPRREQAAMRHAFDRWFGERSSVPLLHFYETYFRRHFKEQLERRRTAPKERSTANPFALDLVDRLDGAHTALQGRILERWRALGDRPAADAAIVLERADVEAALESVPCAGSAPGPTSVSLFVQLLPGDERTGEPTRLVARSYLTGFGKYFSRFLPLLPDDVTRDLRRSNSRLAGSHEILAEICGDASFNANLHPPLLPVELSYPTGESGDAAQLPTSELVVTRDADDPHRLRLVHAPSGRAVVPVDLGFMNPRMRPPLFQLLSLFTPVVSFNLSPPERLEPAALEARDDEPFPVIVRPRITYRDALVLARRQWRVDGRALPSPDSSDDAFGHFARVDAWRRELGLPSRVFLRLEAHGRAPREHLYKPQLIDFESPLLVELLGRLGDSLGDTPYHALFEECLPEDRHLVSAPDGSRWATELILQVDLPSGGGPDGGPDGDSGNDSDGPGAVDR